MTEITHIHGKEEFTQEVLNHTGIVLVDFYADWCGPCRMIGPIMEELQNENTTNGVKIVKVNVDENQDLAIEFDVSSIPVVFIAQNGAVKEGFMGANPKSFYQGKINQYLSSEESTEETE